MKEEEIKQFLEGIEPKATTKIDDGGQAYPVVCSEADVVYPGLTKREYFAGLAFAQASRDVWTNHKYEDVAKRAVGLADALMAALKE